MPVRHVPKHVKNVQKIVKEIREWKNAKVYAEHVRMPAVNVQKNAEAIVAMLNQHNNVRMPVVHVQKNVVSTITNNAGDVLKNAETAKQNVERLRLNSLVIPGYRYSYSGSLVYYVFYNVN